MLVASSTGATNTGGSTSPTVLVAPVLAIMVLVAVSTSATVLVAPVLATMVLFASSTRSSNNGISCSVCYGTSDMSIGHNGTLLPKN